MQARTLNQIAVILSGLMTLMVTFAASAEAATSAGSDQKTIGFTFVNNLEKKVPKADAAIFFAYWDPKKGEWEKSSKQTDSGGRCSFLVPAGEKGESYTFVYATERDQIDKAVEEVSKGKRLAWRIPPGKQQELELLVDGRLLSNTKGSIQMWSNH